MLVVTWVRQPSHTTHGQAPLGGPAGDTGMDMGTMGDHAIGQRRPRQRIASSRGRFCMPHTTHTSALARSRARKIARALARAPARPQTRMLARSHAVNGHVTVVAGGGRPDHAARGGRPGDISAVSSFRLVRQIMSERAASVRRTFGFASRESPAGVPTRAMQVQSTSLAEIKVVRAPLPDRNGRVVYAHWWRSQSRAAGFARWFAHVPCAVGGHGC